MYSSASSSQLLPVHALVWEEQPLPQVSCFSTSSCSATRDLLLQLHHHRHLLAGRLRAFPDRIVGSLGPSLQSNVLGVDGVQLHEVTVQHSHLHLEI